MPSEKEINKLENKPFMPLEFFLKKNLYMLNCCLFLHLYLEAGLEHMTVYCVFIQKL